MAQPAAVLSILVKANTGAATTGLLRLNAELGGVDSRSQNAAKSVSRLVRNVALVGAAGTVAGIGFAVKKFADFESQMSNLASVTDASGKQMEQFRRQALKAGADTKFSALEAAQAQTELAKGGLSVQRIMRGGLKSALALAAAGEMELADAAEATVNAMKLFGLRGRDAMKVADGFATAANRTTADVSDFALALKMGGSAAKAAGLTFQETTTALMLLAENGIKGSDAGTSLKSMLTQIAAPTEKAEKVMSRLNLSFFDAQGNMKGLGEISRMLQDRFRGMTKEQILATTKTIAGTDGLRALLALYDAGPRKIGAFEESLGKQGTAADMAKRKQDNLAGSVEQLMGSLETLAISVGSIFAPGVRVAADELTELTNQITKITQRQDLDVGEKLQRSLDVAKVKLGPWVEKLGQALERMNIPEKIGVAISAVTPVIAGAFAKMAPIAAGAFVKGFLAADVWGRLAVVGWLLMRMGGPPAFLRAGTTAGAAMGAGMAGGVAASGLRGRLVGLFKAWGPAIGIGLAVAIGPSLIKKLQDLGIVGQLVKGKAETPKGAVGRAQEIVKDAGPGRKGLEKANEELLKYERDFRRIANLPGKPKKWQDYYNDIADAIRGVRKPIRDRISDFQANEARAEQMGQNIRQAMRRMRIGSGKSWDEMVTLVTDGSRKMLRTGGKNSQKTKDEIHRQFALAARRVQDAMDRKVISVEEGTARLRQLARKELKLYGISAGRVDVVLARGPEGQGPRPHQKGAYISEGKASGDSVPAVLEKGEYVLNRNAVKKVGRKALDHLNFGQAPRFQSGGIVELLHPGNDPAGHGDHLHIAMSTVRAIVALGRRLQKMGWLVGEHPAFGGVGGHAPNSYHYSGRAIDVNWPLPGEERAKIAALLPMLGQAGMAGLGREFKGLPKVNIRGPQSVALDAGQGVLDRVRQAANASIEAVVAAQEGSEFGGFTGPWVEVMRAIAQAKGWSIPDWQTLIQKESSGNPNARNPSSGAYGLGQFLGATAQAYAKYGALSSNGADQIRAMAQYISDRYGTPSRALAFHNANNWYSRGGAVEMARGGAPISRMVKKSLKRLSRPKTPKQRKAVIDKLAERVREFGLPDQMSSNLKSFSKSANVAGEMADRASLLTFEDANGNPIQGIVGDKSQVQWLQEQLEALFKYRNEILRAEKLAQKKRDEIGVALALAVMARNGINQQILRDEKRREALEKRLQTLQKNPRQNREAIKNAKRDLDGLKAHIRSRTGDRDALARRAIPAMEGKRSGLNTLRGDLLSSLETVQGFGSSMDVMKTLPTPGVLGGDILRIQMQLRDLNAPRQAIQDTTSDSARAEIAESIAAEERRARAILAAQLPALKDIPRLMGLQSFHTGGVVQGPRGVDIPAVLRAGEVVLTADQARAMGTGQPVYVIVQDDAIDKSKIKVVARNEINQVGSTVSLGLQGIRSAPGDLAGFQ